MNYSSQQTHSPPTYTYSPQPTYGGAGNGHTYSESTDTFDEPFRVTHSQQPSIQMSDRTMVNRTPSPTPSEAEVLSMKGFYNRKKIFEAEFWKNKKNVAIAAVLVLVTILTIIISIFHDKIVHALKPATDFLHDTPAGFLVPVAILIVLSFPPLFGHEIVAALCGLVWGIAAGWGIVVLGTFLGELANYFVFKYWCRGRAGKLEHKSIYYGCFARVVREGGLWIPLVARYSVIPPHFVTMIFSTCGMKLWVFAVSALLSMPRQLAPVVLGTLLFQDSTNESKQDKTKQNLLTFGVIAVTTVVTIIAMRIIGRRMEEMKPTFIHERRKRRQLGLKTAHVESNMDASMTRVNLLHSNNPSESEPYNPYHSAV